MVLYNSNNEADKWYEGGEKMKEMTMKDIRIKKKLTQDKVAQITGFSKDYISMIERGKRNPSDNAKAKFAEAYNVPIVQIFLSIQRTKNTLSKKE
jgi:putative transcriptional regulator